MQNRAFKPNPKNVPVIPVIWFALPSIPQPSVNATAWVAQSPLVTFLELQAVLLLQLVFVVREALKIFTIISDFLKTGNLFRFHVKVRCQIAIVMVIAVVVIVIRIEIIIIIVIVIVIIFAIMVIATIMVFIVIVITNIIIIIIPGQLCCNQVHLWASHSRHLLAC